MESMRSAAMLVPSYERRARNLPGRADVRHRLAVGDWPTPRAAAAVGLVEALVCCRADQRTRQAYGYRSPGRTHINAAGRRPRQRSGTPADVQVLAAGLLGQRVPAQHARAVVVADVHRYHHRTADLRLLQPVVDRVGAGLLLFGEVIG